MRLALAQCSPSPVDLEANLLTAARLLAEAAEHGAQLVVFPELWLTGYELAAIAGDPSLALGPDDPRLDPLRQLCQRAQLTAVLGSPWRDRSGSDDSDERPLLAAPILHPDGSVHVSAKLHLHGKERDVFRPGAAASPFPLHGWRVAVAICYDVAIPSHAAAAAAAGADLYLGSALYAVGEERRCDLHFGARAMDHRMFTALANYPTGYSPSSDPGGALTSIGGSGAWRPSGEVLQRVSADDNRDQLVHVELDHLEVHAFRAA